MQRCLKCVCYKYLKISCTIFQTLSLYNKSLHTCNSPLQSLRACLRYFSFLIINFSTVYGGKICFLELVILELVSLVVKRAVGQASNTAYVLVSPQDLMSDQCHRGSLEYQMKNCCVQQQRLVHLYGKRASRVVQINIFEHPCHGENYVPFHPHVFSLYLLHHYEIYPVKKKLQVSAVFRVVQKNVTWHIIFNLDMFCLIVNHYT